MSRVLILLWAAACGALHVGPPNHLIDENGRHMLFHGVNVVYKGAPWVPNVEGFDPDNSFSEKDVENLADWGANVVRFGVMWPGVEPSKGAVNGTYLDIVGGIVDMLWSRNISTLLDFHQDVLAERFCGEGVPEWFFGDTFDRTFPHPLSGDFFIPGNTTSPIPTQDQCARHGWATYQAARAVGKAYQWLYEHPESMTVYWNAVAGRFRGHPGVLGYEIINEPWPGDVYKDPSLLVPGEADRKVFQGFYEAIASVIRAQDPDAILFFEPLTWDDVRCGFSEVPGGNNFKNRSVLSFHHYSPPNLPAKGSIDRANGWAKSLGCAAFLTEVDTPTIGKHDAPVHSLDEADRQWVSWIGWEYKPFFKITGWHTSFYDKHGAVQWDNVLHSVGRTYARAVAGIPTRHVFDPDTGNFVLSFTCNDPQAVTEVFAHPKWYGDRVPTLWVAIGTFSDVRHDNISHVFYLGGCERGNLTQVSIRHH